MGIPINATLAAVSNDAMQHELLSRAIVRHRAKNEQMRAELDARSLKQLARLDELARIEERLRAVQAEVVAP